MQILTIKQRQKFGLIGKPSWLILIKSSFTLARTLPSFIDEQVKAELTQPT